MTSSPSPKTPAIRAFADERAARVEMVTPWSTPQSPAQGIELGLQDVAVVGPDVVSDDDVDGALRSARGFAARGAFAQAADVLQDLLARRPGARVVDVVSSEAASLLAKAGDVPAACALWSSHRRGFSTSDNGAAVTAALARYRCP